MPKVQTTVTVKEEVKLDARLQKKLQTELSDYLDVQKQINALKDEANTIKATIETLREKAGYKSFKQEAFTVTRVEGTRTFVDNKYMVDEGWISSEQLAEATKTVPKKAFTKISHPELKRKKGEDEDE